MLGRLLNLPLKRAPALNLLLPRLLPTSEAAFSCESGVSSTQQTASGPSNGQAPWPWLNPSAPQVLPHYVKTVGEAKLKLLSSFTEALAVVKGRAEERKSGKLPGPLLSGRVRTLTFHSSTEESVELVIQLNLAANKKDQLIKDTIHLPFGTGQKCRIAVIAKGTQADIAREAGADIVGGDDLIDKIILEKKKAVTFDRLVVTPDFMKSVAKAGRVLGPKGLMPSAKLGTLTDDIEKAIKLTRAGVLDFRADKGGNVHAVVGKARFKTEELLLNIGAFVQVLLDSRPNDLPGDRYSGYFKLVSLKTSLTSPVRLSPAACADAVQAWLAYKQKTSPVSKAAPETTT